MIENKDEHKRWQKREKTFLNLVRKATNISWYLYYYSTSYLQKPN